MGHDITTAHADHCGVCQSDDIVTVGNCTRVTCVECDANGIRAGRNQWLWATGRAVRAMQAAFDDADRRFESD